VALGLLLAVLVLAYLLLVHPWWTVPMQAEAGRIDSLQQRELRARMQLGQEPQVDQALEGVRQQQSRTAGFLPESSAQLATAGLIKRLETVVEQASPGNRACMIQNRSPLTEPSRQRYARVAVQVRLKCGVPETAAVLYALESGTPRLFVDNLNVLAQRYFNLAGRAGQGSGGLDVTFDLVGYLRPAPAIAAPRQEADGAS
jgi:general secretion pathway protein M